jgi:hypothetical protein
MRFRWTSHSTWLCYGLFLKEILNVFGRMEFRILCVVIRDPALLDAQVTHRHHHRGDASWAYGSRGRSRCGDSADHENSRAFPEIPRIRH